MWGRLVKESGRELRRRPTATNAIVVRRTVMGPNELSWMEAALAVLAKAGLSPKERYHAFLAIIGLVRGHATFEQVKNHSESPRKWARELADLLRSGGNTYPALREVLATGVVTGDSDDAFEYGLDCILDGIGAGKGGSRAKARRLR